MPGNILLYLNDVANKNPAENSVSQLPIAASSVFGVAIMYGLSFEFQDSSVVMVDTLSTTFQATKHQLHQPSFNILSPVPSLLYHHHRPCHHHPYHPFLSLSPFRPASEHLPAESQNLPVLALSHTSRPSHLGWHPTSSAPPPAHKTPLSADSYTHAATLQDPPILSARGRPSVPSP